MTSPHSAPELHGIKFGQVTVTIDLALGDCVVIAPRPGPICTAPRKMRLNSLDEIRGAYATQFRQIKTDPIAADIARALRLAGEKIKEQQKGSRR